MIELIKLISNELKILRKWAMNRKKLRHKINKKQKKFSLVKKIMNKKVKEILL